MAEKLKESDSPKPKATEIDAVAAELIAIRNQGKRDRKGCFIKFFHALDKSLNITVSIAKTDALLIKATIERFDVSPDADIVLMALGLLQGYEYQKVLLLNRRKKYLRESNYLQTNSRSENKIFDDASKKEQERLLNNLRKTGEDDLIRSLAEFLLKQNIKDYINNLDGYITEGNSPTAILPEPSYSLSDTTDGAKHEGTETKAKSDRDEISPIVVKIINIIGAGSSRPEKGNNPWISITISVIVLLLVCMPIALRRSQPPTSTGAGAGICVPTEQLVMQSGEVYEIKPLLLTEASEIVEGAHFEYESSDSNVLKVLNDGILYAQNGLAEGESASVELTVRGPNDTTKKVTITVENSKDEENPPIDTDDIESFVIAYTIENQVRLVGGDKTWGNGVEAKIGDIVEFRVAYMNNDTVDHMNVMISDILPDGLHYVPGSTKLVNSIYSEGGSVDQDDIITSGINIGGYAPGSNAFVRFRAEVMDSNLEYGSNTLVNWAQGGVNGAAIQDYATVHVYKS